MALTVKGGGAQPPQEPQQKKATDTSKTAAQTFVRLSKQKKRRGAAAAEVGETIDNLVGNEDELANEREAAKQLADEVSENLPEGTGLEQAEAIAEQLKQRIESTRDQRGHLAQKVQAAFDDLE